MSAGQSAHHNPLLLAPLSDAIIVLGPGIGASEGLTEQLPESAVNLSSK
jgi:hypothetical protein